MDEPLPTGWRHWYHTTLGTYGRWLPGDERGWCERNHRKHVPGTARNPAPPSKFSQGLNAYARKLLKRDPVSFAPEQFPIIGAHLLNSAAIQQALVLAISVGYQHCHLLIQCMNDEARKCSGNLKGHVYHRMFSGQMSPWGKRSHEEPIADYAHGVRAYHYILKHVEEGAWVWDYKSSEGREIRGNE